VTTQANPSSVTNLQRLLARREHQAFLDELLLALEDADCSQRDYLAALGGEGLYVLLHGESAPALLGAYASLLLSGKIHASANIVLDLNQRMPSADLAALADKLARNHEGSFERSPGKPQASYAHREQPPIQLRRVIQIIDMGFGTYSASDALGLKRSVFRSEQERTFLQALSLRFPGLHAFPNYPLDQLADFDKLGNLLDAETLEYGKHCRIDAVLVVPGEGDPVAAFELDSRLHDEPAQARRDRLRNRLFRVIQIPFFRLRAEQNQSVGVDEWYALLTDEVADRIDCGRRIRVRALHPTLIPV
jgi:hypothetical protein